MGAYHEVKKLSWKIVVKIILLGRFFFPRNSNQTLRTTFWGIQFIQVCVNQTEYLNYYLL